MWLLKSKDGDKLLYLKSNTENTVGRNLGDVVFPTDKSVSRKHATLYVDSDGVLIEDHKSTYGTYMNDGILQQERIEPAQKLKLNAKDVVKFGILGSEWTLQKIDYTTCLSTFKDGDVFNSIKAQLHDLGVNISKDWQPECTHLTMPCITLTLKVVSALVYLRPIVAPSFWAQCLRCRGDNLPMPDPHAYLPQIKESVLSQQANFHLEPKRSTLFEGKHFIFFSRQQLNNYRSIIQEAGGRASLLRDCKMTNSELCVAASIVVQYISSRMTQDTQEAQTRIEDIVRYMASKKCRVVPESDIGLAILYVSIEKYCNPRFSFASVITEKQDRPNMSSGVRVLAPETEDILDSQSSGSTVRSTVVQETFRSLQHNTSLSSASSRDCSGLFENSFIKDEPVCSSTMISATKVKAVSPAHEEPASKRRNTRSTRNDENMSCTELMAPPADSLFQFAEEEVRPSTSKPMESLQLTIQGSKRKRAPSPCKEEDLFNFVPEFSKPLDSQCVSVGSEASGVRGRNSGNAQPLSVSPLKTASETESTLNLRKSIKRKLAVGSDNVDGECSDIKVHRFISPEKLDISSSLWFSKKNFMATHFTIKAEDDNCSGLSAENEVMLKLKELDLKPAIVELSDLVVKKTDSSLQDSRVASDTFSGVKKNFKKFSKVKHVKSPAESTSFMLVAYEARTDNANMDNFVNASSDEEDKNEDFASFMSLGRQKTTGKCRTRRL